MLTFDAENHKYFWNGKEVPGVTEILKKIGITRDYEKVDNFYRERGQHVHKAIEFYTSGTLDEDSLDPVNVLPYFKAFQKFQVSDNYRVKKTEVPLYSQKYGFAGTIDQTGALYNGTSVAEDGITDIKVTESSDKAADLQLCMYANLFYENVGYWPSFRMVLELHGDEKATPIFYKTDPKICAAIMEIYRWKTTRREKSPITSAK